ncbi:PREDICTED: phospholipase ABHD3-like, partial [Priapulus caudatus]|uniref:Phospholipase ABHD3-like n=1 Tax=Priapulus caudatus TaxID=37621 RepID=A0ABM1E672_PRICU
MLEHCPAILETYWPTPWLFESRMQSIFRSLFKRRIMFDYRSELLCMPDGGEVCLDWMDNDENSNVERAKRPTILMLPGLTGSSVETYLVHFVKHATKAGFRCVVFNNRGKGGGRLLTARTYNAANTEDLSVVVEHVRKLIPDAPLMATGHSLGGIILTNYLAKTGVDCGLIGGMVVSVSWNVFESSKNLEKPLNSFVFNRFLTYNLIKMVKEYAHLFQHKLDVEHVCQAKTVREFDERFTSKVFGYATNDDYYKDACLHDKIDSIKVPLLCLTAGDDCFSPYDALPIEDAEQSEYMMLAITSHGGHLGFLEGW